MVFHPLFKDAPRRRGAVSSNISGSSASEIRSFLRSLVNIFLLSFAIWAEAFPKSIKAALAAFAADWGVRALLSLLQDMRMYRKDGGRGGVCGIVVYVSRNVLSVRRWDLEDEAIEALWIEVKMRKRHTPLSNQDLLIPTTDALFHLSKYTCSSSCLGNRLLVFR